jgi:hypothetical protein
MIRIWSQEKRMEIPERTLELALYCLGYYRWDGSWRVESVPWLCHAVSRQLTLLFLPNILTPKRPEIFSPQGKCSFIQATPPLLPKLPLPLPSQQLLSHLKVPGQLDQLWGHREVTSDWILWPGASSAALTPGWLQPAYQHLGAICWPEDTYCLPTFWDHHGQSYNGI